MLVKYEIDHLAKVFERFAELECKGKSTLYYQLSRQIAKDKLILQLCRECRERQPIPNLLLGAVHYLLLRNGDDELAQYYPSISGCDSTVIPYDLFKGYCLRKETEVREILQNRIVQTNAVNRTAYLMPIISSLYDADAKLTVIDIGTSSGLALNYDQYRYLYSNGGTFGTGPVEIRSDHRSGTFPPFEAIKQAHRKIGIDQNILDVRECDNALWLKGLIWPDLIDRFARIDAAIKEFEAVHNIELIQANSLSDFRSIISSVPEEEELFVYHTHVLYQFTAEERKAFRSMLAEVGMVRNLNYLAVEGGRVFDKLAYQQGEVIMELTKFNSGVEETEVLGKVDAHGRWIEWFER